MKSYLSIYLPATKAIMDNAMCDELYIIETQFHDDETHTPVQTSGQLR